MRLISKITILFLSLIILFSLQIKLVSAEEVEQLELPKITVYPGSFYYNFKRLFEKGKERLIFSQESKKSFYESLLKTRLAELNFVVEKKFLSEVQQSSERFAFQAGILTEELVRQKKAEGKEKIIKEFEKYSKFLENLRDKYPANSAYWMLIQHDINTLKILTERLK